MRAWLGATNIIWYHIRADRGRKERGGVKRRGGLQGKMKCKAGYRVCLRVEEVW